MLCNVNEINKEKLADFSESYIIKYPPQSVLCYELNSTGPGIAKGLNRTFDLLQEGKVG